MKRLNRLAALAILLAVGAGLATLQERVSAQAGSTQVPRLEVDPLWPQPFAFEKHWTLGSVTGVAVDAQDHIWVTHRGLPSLQGNEKGPTANTWAGECCFAAPLVLEYDSTGKLLNNWGGSGYGYQWPQNPSGITVDGKGNVWIAAAGLPAAAGGGGRGGGRGAVLTGAAGAGGAAGAPAAGAAGGGRGAAGGAPR